MRVLLALVFCVGCGGSSDPNPPPADLAGVSGDALLPFGSFCTSDSECAGGKCFVGGMQTFCTMPCTTATQATDCPSPPTSGSCNMKGYCKP